MIDKKIDIKKPTELKPLAPRLAAPMVKPLISTAPSPDSITARVASILNRSNAPAKPQTILSKYTPLAKQETTPTYKPLRVVPKKEEAPCGAHEYNRKDFGKY